MKFLGVHWDGSIIWSALVTDGNSVVVEGMEAFRVDEARTKFGQIAASSFWVVSGLDVDQVLIRSFDLKIKQKHAALSALPFQLEALLPFPAEKAIVLPFFQKEKDSTTIHIVATSREDVAKHLSQFETAHLVPEQISCTPKALCRAAQFFMNKAPSLMIHIGSGKGVCASSLNGHLIATQPLSIGLNHLMGELQRDCPLASPAEVEQLAARLDLSTLSELDYPHLSNLLSKLQKEIDRTLAFFAQKSSSEQIFLSGTLFSHFHLGAWLKNHLEKSHSVHTPPSEISPYTIAVGLSLDALASDGLGIQMRQGEFVTLRTVKKKLSKTLRYLTTCGAAAAIAWGGVVAMLAYKKNRFAKTIEAATGVPGSGSFATDLENWERKLLTQKQPFLFHSSVPTARAVLAWLSTLPSSSPSFPGERIEITDFDYSLVKYPKISEQSMPYVGKIEIEIMAPSPQLASLFLDGLKRAEHIVNTKNEISWKAEQNRYRASFFLKGN
jgi:Tfp pilus assembly PilM family ATPase